MAHLTENTDDWYAGSPIDVKVTVTGVSEADLSDLKWVLDGVVEKSGSAITTSDNSDGDAVVVVSLDETDVTSTGVYHWQLIGSVSTEGPKVLGKGTLSFAAILTA